MWLFWLVAAGIFFVGEIITVGFLIFWLGIAAVLAMLTSFFTENVVIQTAVFVISYIVLILLTKPLINKYISKDDKVATNAYRVIGKKGIVIKKIPADGIGQVKVSGEIWSATSNADIAEGTKVKILEINGVKLIVAPL